MRSKNPNKLESYSRWGKKYAYWGKTRRLLKNSKRRTYKKVHRNPVYYRLYLEKGHARAKKLYGRHGQIRNRARLITLPLFIALFVFFILYLIGAI